MPSTIETDVLGDWLTLAEAAKLAGVGRSTADRDACSGKLPHATICDRRLFRRTDVLAWAAGRREDHRGDDDGSRQE